MTGPVVLLLAVAANSNGVAITREAAAACIESIQSGARSIVRVVPTLPDDVELAAEASAARADAIVVLTWHDATFLTTDVRAAVTAPGAKGQASQAWIARTVVFSARDQPTERGRTLGLVIASMLRERWGDESPTTGEPSGPPHLPHVEPGPGAPPAAVAVIASAPEPEAPARWALEANLTTFIDSSEGIDFDAVGGTLALRRSVSSHLALRAGLGYRLATVDGADASTISASAMVGIAWTSSGLGRPHEFGFGARLDFIGMHDEITRNTPNSSPPNTHGYWSLGGDMLGQVGYGLSRGTALLLGGGLEGNLTAADIVVAGRSTATVPHEHLVFETGILSRF